MSMLATACSSIPYTQPSDVADSVAIPAHRESVDGEEIALRALALVGKPYIYGGADLQGFDCSGLVYYIHDALGIMVPRTAADQQRAATSVDKSALHPGDLVFFATTKNRRVSHVGVYVGENRFVHAPSSGKLIELRTLDDLYYSSHLVDAGRFYSDL
ncbi:MAG: C40 family peptidase [Steroidobacteraceae bacterium]